MIFFTLSKQNVFVTIKPHPCSKHLLIIGKLVTGGAEAKPKGFSNLTPQISTDMSTSSMSVWNRGSWGLVLCGKP